MFFFLVKGTVNKQEQLDKISQEIAHCTLCRQHSLGKLVPGEGNPDASVMFVGEAPGKNEAETGRPFVGRSGQLLRKNIRAIGLAEKEVFITSVCKYLPITGTPTSQQIALGAIYLKQQIDIINPKVLVLLGSVACKGVLGTPVLVAKEHGTVIMKDGRTCLISYHPAAALRFTKNLTYFRQDFQHLKELIATL